MRKAILLGLHTVQPIYEDSDSLVLPYIPGENVREHVMKGDSSVIVPALISLKNGHDKGIVHGDRWGNNMIVGKNITHIDFDFEIGGPLAPELEVAQLVYDIIRRTPDRDEAVTLIRQYAHLHSTQYQWSHIGEFVRGYDQYYGTDILLS
jgi:tRNA A-37 threonylcarbamoyl transferase component Bud32